MHSLEIKQGSKEKFTCLDFLFKVLRNFGFWQKQNDDLVYKCINVIVVAGQISHIITNWLTIYLKARSWSNIDRAFQDLMFAITSKFSLIFLPIILGISD